jgi:hypothetical protein
MDDPDAPGKAGHLGQDVAAQEDGHAVFLRHPKEQVADFNDPGGIQAIGRFVQQKQARVVEQRLGQSQALAVSQGERSGSPVGIAGQAELFDGAVNRCRFQTRTQSANGLEVLAHRQFRIGIRRLDEVADSIPASLADGSSGRARTLRRTSAGPSPAAGAPSSSCRPHSSRGRHRSHSPDAATRHRRR